MYLGNGPQLDALNLLITKYLLNTPGTLFYLEKHFDSEKYTLVTGAKIFCVRTICSFEEVEFKKKKPLCNRTPNSY